MKTILKKTQWFTVITTLCLVAVTFFASGCDEKEIPLNVGNNVSFTPCQPSKLRSSGLSDKVDVEFTTKGVQITHYDFEVPCDFTTVNVNHTLVNGVLNITQQGSPNHADCVCYTDVSYTIDGILQDEVNVIFINGVQVYCYYENVLQGTKWKLIEVSTVKDYQQSEIFDYSEKNIIYEFQRNNKLVITGNIDDLFVFDNFQKGEHFYEYKEPNIGPTASPGPNLTIGNPVISRYYCLVDLDKENTMIISGFGRVIEKINYGATKSFIKLK